MKHAASGFLIVFVLLAFAGTVFAAEMSGEVTAVDTAKNAFTVKSEAGTTEFVCEAASVIKEVRVSDKVTVTYKKEGGKKVAEKITQIKKKVSVEC